MIAKVLQVFTPGFYTQMYKNIVANTHKQMKAGSVQPLFKAMLLVGVVGYGMEYSMVGKYHVAEKQALVKKAMEGHHH